MSAARSDIPFLSTPGQEEGQMFSPILPVPPPAKPVFDCHDEATAHLALRVVQQPTPDMYVGENLNCTVALDLNSTGPVPAFIDPVKFNMRIEAGAIYDTVSGIPSLRTDVVPLTDTEANWMPMQKAFETLRQDGAKYSVKLGQWVLTSIHLPRPGRCRIIITVQVSSKKPLHWLMAGIENAETAPIVVSPVPVREKQWGPLAERAFKLSDKDSKAR